MTQGPFDPLALWRDMLAKWESSFNDAANQNMASPEFSRFMNQAMGMSVRMHQTMGELMGKYLTAMNMPSRADLVAISERLQSIEDQLARISAAVERGSAGAPAEAKPYARPPRTKRPHGLNGPPPAAVEADAAAEVMPPPAARPARRAAKKKRQAS
ncbi:MAG: hypothetical protein K2X43_15910 [Hyphomonadaceae bacterium]|jgi:hypothetical protein|nr:hypothetical protein [Hyphomonadaceae bacterium]